MAYTDFAHYYDELNGAADYDALFCAVQKELLHCGIKSGILADLGCGTGEMTMRLAKAGYDMISVDLSQDMLCIARDKMYDSDMSGILFLQQDLTKLDLFGTIRGAVCTFDTLNHIGPFESFKKAIEQIALFLEPNCPFMFDMNTPYKHEKVLANNTFTIDTGDVLCTWVNKYDAKNKRTKIELTASENDDILFEDSFYEYAYTLSEITQVCEGAGLKIVSVCDGESDDFGELKNDSERYFITAIKAASR